MCPTSHGCEQTPYLECGESVGRDVEGGDLHVLEEVVEVFRVEHDLGQGLEAGALAQHRPAVQRDLLMLVPVKSTTISHTIFILHLLNYEYLPFAQSE